jgi:hypothetical protein
VLVAAVVAAASLAACGRGQDAPAAVRTVEDLGPGPVPAEMLGLKLHPESVEVLKAAERPFVDAVGLYSLRSPDDLLQATLQLSRFSPDADYRSERFQQAVVQQIGSSAPRAFRMGDQTVHLTTGRRQSVAVWFKDRYLFVLATREEFEQPRSLLRAALAITPA